MRHGVSPIFISLVLFTVTMAGFLWFGIGNNPQLFMFAFIIGGWLVSLCLHEFGHAVTAFWGGDESVESKGYLTLNPLKYTHPIISIVIPLVMLLMGGIAFPGGAVYINIHALRKPNYRSLVSAAGPLANLLCLFLLALPFGSLPFYFIFSKAPFEFLSAIGLLALLQPGPRLAWRGRTSRRESKRWRAGEPRVSRARATSVGALGRLTRRDGRRE